MYRCDCCGNKTLNKKDEYEICSICDWADNRLQRENPLAQGCANPVNLKKAREHYLRYQQKTYAW